jgi:hypothetical protein
METVTQAALGLVLLLLLCGLSALLSRKPHAARREEGDAQSYTLADESPRHPPPAWS